MRAFVQTEILSKDSTPAVAFSFQFRSLLRNYLPPKT